MASKGWTELPQSSFDLHSEGRISAAIPLAFSPTPHTVYLFIFSVSDLAKVRGSVLWMRNKEINAYFNGSV